MSKRYLSRSCPALSRNFRPAQTAVFQSCLPDSRLAVQLFCLNHPNSKRGFAMAYVIAEPCIGTKDSACVDACPVDCIHPKKDEGDFEGSDQLFIDPVECIDCGACVPVCPVSAIFAADDLPEKWADYAGKNSAHYGR